MGTRMMRITQIFTDFTLLGFLIKRYVLYVLKTSDKCTKTKSTHKNCRTFDTKKSVRIRVIRIIRVPITRNMNNNW